MLHSTTARNLGVYASSIYCLNINLTHEEMRGVKIAAKKMKFYSISEYVASIIARFGRINADSLSCICNVSSMQVDTGSEKIINCRVSSENMNILKGYMTYLEVPAEQVARNFLLVASSIGTPA